jgi:hypothetical protein
MKRRSLRNKPTLEHLEGRLLLNSSVDLQAEPTSARAPRQPLHQQSDDILSFNDRRINYTTPDGTKVIVTLYGLGSLGGSSVTPDGALDLVYSDTNAFSGIIGHVSGGTHRANLHTMSNLKSNILNLSGGGSSPLGPVNLKDFDLVDGGSINLTGGVGKLLLNSSARNSEIHLKALPVSTSSSSSSGDLGSATGIDVVINHVTGDSRSTPALGNPQIFGYDPTANTLIRFDADTGEQLQTIPLVGLGTAISGVAMARDHGALVALIGDGTTIQAFDAVSGSFVGQFSTTNLAPLGFHTIDGIGSTDYRTVITDASAGTAGLALRIDVSKSLDNGVAEAVGDAFAPQREFEFSGGATGLAASEIIYVTGAAHFDSAQPDLTQFGIMRISTSGGTLKESSRTEITGPAAIVNAGPPGTARANPTNAFASIDQDLALITDDQNTVTIYNPQTLAIVGTVTLDDPNRLSALSESFHPELQGSFLLDVQGNLRSFRALDAQGMVINDSGGINIVQIHNAADSAIVGHPIQHVNIPIRQNVILASTVRIDTTIGNIPIGHRGGVTIINPNLRAFGPLSLPRD